MRKLVIKIIGNKSFKDYSSPEAFMKDARRSRSILFDTLFSNKLTKSYPAEVRLIRIFGYPGLVFFAITFVLIFLANTFR